MSYDRQQTTTKIIFCFKSKNYTATRFRIQRGNKFKKSFENKFVIKRTLSRDLHIKTII